MQESRTLSTAPSCALESASRLSGHDQARLAAKVPLCFRQFRPKVILCNGQSRQDFRFKAHRLAGLTQMLLVGCAIFAPSRLFLQRDIQNSFL